MATARVAIVGASPAVTGRNQPEAAIRQDSSRAGRLFGRIIRLARSGANQTLPP